MASKQHGIKHKLFALYLKLFGIPDLHAHIRFRAIKPFFQPTNRNVEIGAGGAIMSVGFSMITRKPILALTYTEEEERNCRMTIKQAGLEQLVTIGREDALKLNSIGYGVWDQVLLIDVLEHVKGDDFKVLQNINRILRPGGYLIISVPTLLFPSIFGEEFDKFAWTSSNKKRYSGEITHHLRHYTLNKLEELLIGTGFRIIDWQYHTNPFAAKLCHIWYKHCYNHPYLRYILMPIFNLLSMSDQFSSIKKQREPLRSAGISLLAIKEKDC
jgi:SAM-dependent methyltransferase